MRAIKWLQGALEKIDPAPEGTEPLTPLPVAVLFLATCVSLYFFLSHRIPPMQDAGHHAAVTAVVAGYSKAGSIYPAIYHPVDLFGVNSLLYTVAGYGGRIIGASLAFRLSIASYHFFLPIATLYALRVFGRSPWAAIASVPIAYNISYVFGFVNFLVAAPLAIASVAAMYQLLTRPTRRRFIVTATLVFFLALAHVHVFAWTSILLAGLALWLLAVSIRASLTPNRVLSPLRTAALAAGAMVPASIIFIRWYLRILAGPRPDEYVVYFAEKPTAQSYSSALKPIARSLGDLGDFLSLTTTDADARLLIAFLMIGAIATILRMRVPRTSPPVLELCSIATAISFFVIPEHYGGQAVIASRQIGFALWFAPVFFEPLPASVSRPGRWAVIAAILFLTGSRFQTWHTALRGFWTETAGLDEVLAAAPPHKKMQYNDMQPNSRYFRLGTFRQVEKFYMLDGFGQCDDNPALGTMSAIRYRNTFVRGALPVHSPSWPSAEALWRDFDLLLIHKWAPTPAQLATAQQHGTRIAKSGDWELWQANR